MFFLCLLPFSCFGKKRAKRSRLKRALCVALPRAKSVPLKDHPAALTTLWSTLTYILNTAKMFRFLLCSGSASEIRQGGESGAAANSKARIVLSRRENATQHPKCVRVGYIGAGAICRAAARHERRPYADFFGYFLVRRQESNRYPVKEKEKTHRRSGAFY